MSWEAIHRRLDKLEEAIGHLLRKVVDLEKQIDRTQKSVPDLAAEAVEAQEINRIRDSYMSGKKRRERILTEILKAVVATLTGAGIMFLLKKGC
jgi:K+/H+ antiporter YhaU regulatory subunit KhtT